MNKYQLCRKTGLAIMIIGLVFFSNTGCSKSGLKPANALTGNNIEPAAESAQGLRKACLPAFIIDQADTLLKNINSRNILYVYPPMGQEFTPTLKAMDAVVLKVDDASCSLEGSDGGTMKVQIRKGTIDGPIIGTSYTLHFANCFFGDMRFDFLRFIKLSPGNVYIIEPVYVAGHSASVYIDEGPGALYPKGDLIVKGLNEPGRDMYFKEGLYNFIARTKDQVKELGWENLVREDGSTFRNHGECIKYINGH